MWLSQGGRVALALGARARRGQKWKGWARREGGSHPANRRTYGPERLTYSYSTHMHAMHAMMHVYHWCCITHCSLTQQFNQDDAKYRRDG